MPDPTASDLTTTPSAFLAAIGITGTTAAALIAAQPYASVMPHQLGQDGICAVCGLHDVEIEDAPLELACLGRWVAAEPGDNPSLVGPPD